MLSHFALPPGAVMAKTESGSPCPPLSLTDSTSSVESILVFTVPMLARPSSTTPALRSRLPETALPASPVLQLRSLVCTSPPMRPATSVSGDHPLLTTSFPAPMLFLAAPFAAARMDPLVISQRLSQATPALARMTRPAPSQLPLWPLLPVLSRLRTPQSLLQLHLPVEASSLDVSRRNA